MAAVYGLPSEREERKKKEKSRPLLDSLVGTILSQVGDCVLCKSQSKLSNHASASDDGSRSCH